MQGNTFFLKLNNAFTHFRFYPPEAGEILETELSLGENRKTKITAIICFKIPHYFKSHFLDCPPISTIHTDEEGEGEEEREKRGNLRQNTSEDHYTLKLRLQCSYHWSVA